MHKTYNPSDWYWIADDGRIFSSARAVLVQSGDALFSTWSEDGTAPTPWPRDEAGQQTDASLQDVLQPYGIVVSTAKATKKN